MVILSWIVLLYLSLSVVGANIYYIMTSGDVWGNVLGSVLIFLIMTFVFAYFLKSRKNLIKLDGLTTSFLHSNKLIRFGLGIVSYLLAFGCSLMLIGNVEAVGFSYFGLVLGVANLFLGNYLFFGF